MSECQKHNTKLIVFWSSDHNRIHGINCSNSWTFLTLKACCFLSHVTPRLVFFVWYSFSPSMKIPPAPHIIFPSVALSKTNNLTLSFTSVDIASNVCCLLCFQTSVFVSRVSGVRSGQAGIVSIWIHLPDTVCLSTVKPVYNDHHWNPK